MKNSKSTILLILSNVVTIILAVEQQWALEEVMIIYWSQSVIIGLFAIIRMISLKTFSLENMANVGNHDKPPSSKTKYTVAVFFLVHYGIFHLVYIGFLGFNLEFLFLNITTAVLCVGLFTINHAFESVFLIARDRKANTSLGKIMIVPYARIIPMHIVLIAGGFFSFSVFLLAVFLILKTGADVVMERLEYTF